MLISLPGIIIIFFGVEPFRAATISAKWGTQGASKSTRFSITFLRNTVFFFSNASYLVIAFKSSMSLATAVLNENEFMPASTFLIV